LDDASGWNAAEETDDAGTQPNARLGCALAAQTIEKIRFDGQNGCDEAVRIRIVLVSQKIEEAEEFTCNASVT